MASLCLNSLLPLPPSHPHKLVEPYSSLLSTFNCNEVALKPIVIDGDPPTIVSAPARRIIAVGDLHGDLSKARDALQLAGALSSDGRDQWIGQYTVSKILQDTLQAVGAKAMVVGHTPQLSGVNCENDCGIWRVDVGMSSGVLDSTLAVLEIKGDKARVIRSNQDRLHELQVADYI